MAEQAFSQFIVDFQKTYSYAEMSYRFSVFKDNLNTIQEHNEKGLSWTMAVNQFSDLTADEFSAAYTGGFVGQPSHAEHVYTNPSPNGAVDWVSAGAVTPVKDQGQCGSCWSFSATGSIEGAHQIATKELTSFSEQQLVSCSLSYGNLGCNGGLMDAAFQYVMDHGLCTEADYPYTAKSDFLNCKAKSCATAGKITGFHDVTPNNEDDLMTAVDLGPVSVAIEADQMVFQSYSGGVLDGNCGTNLDHGVLVVGYGTDNGVDYWKVKNSWSASWGEEGYIRMVRGKNMCGIAMQPSYPTGAN
jgi:C1A family cysteine protease